MCDYSLHAVATRPAKVGDKLTVTSFPNIGTFGLAAESDKKCAVCIKPGTELAFERNIQYYGRWHMLLWSAKTSVAKFTRIDTNNPDRHHDAIELPTGEIISLQKLLEGQRVTVLQLPVVGQKAGHTAMQVRSAPQIFTGAEH